MGWRDWRVWDRVDALDRRSGLRSLSPERELRLVRWMTYAFVVGGLVLGSLSLALGHWLRALLWLLFFVPSLLLSLRQATRRLERRRAAD